jgi:preprotein translocase subunit Sec63
VSEGADESTHESSHATFSDPSFSDPYQVLGLDKAASRSDLLTRYRQLMSANHPDKVAQLDPEIQAFASERSRRIIQAYEEITAQNSW